MVLDMPWLNQLPAGFAIVPSISVLGAFFPDWIFCLLGSVLLTVLVHQGLKHTGWTKGSERVLWLAIDPAVLVIGALICWLTFFKS